MTRKPAKPTTTIVRTNVQRRKQLDEYVVVTLTGCLAQIHRFTKKADADALCRKHGVQRPKYVRPYSEV